MKEITITDIHKISNILNGLSPEGKKLKNELDFKTHRYLIVLFCGQKFTIFKDKVEHNGKKIGLTSPALKKIANYLELNFDRSKQSSKIYTLQEKEKLVKISKIDNYSYYKLTPKGLGHCRKSISELLALVDLWKDKKLAYESTQQYNEDNKAKFDKIMALPENERQKAFEKLQSQGELFRQPTPDEHKVELILRNFRKNSK